MDPYLDAHWRDVHARLIIYASDALQTVLPKSLRARVEERVLLETPAGYATHPLYPDVRVVEYTWKRDWESAPASGVAVATPLILDLDAESATEPFLEIIDLESGNRVVTMIEFLSPSNKTPGLTREQYLRKQNEICSSTTNLVEIDLTRIGINTMAFPQVFLRPPIGIPYGACVRRATQPSKREIYPMPLAQRLPTINIPLRPEDADVPLDLQALIDQCYRNGGYEGTLNYAIDAHPPLLGAEKDWADEWLREKKLRPRKKRAPRKSKRKSR